VTSSLAVLVLGRSGVGTYEVVWEKRKPRNSLIFLRGEGKTGEML
jgi:hypothetical protein